MKFSTSKAYVAPGLMRKELQISLYSKAWHSANQNDNITSLFWKHAPYSLHFPIANTASTQPTTSIGWLMKSSRL